METEFYAERRKAAYERANLLKDFYTASVTIDDIYENYGVMFSETAEELERKKNIELQVEYDLIFARESIKKLFQFALGKGKKVIITTDMYLPQEFLEKVLRKNGYDGWDKIYVSCEQNATKRSGVLFDRILEELEKEGIYAENVLHIGDDPESDADMPASRGISAVRVPSAMSRFNECRKLANIKNWNSTVYSGTQNLLIGLYADLIFDDPFAEFDAGTLFDGNPYNLGEYLAPFFVSFCLWMLREVKKDGVDRLALIWRDGYIPEKIIGRLFENMEDELPVMERITLNRALRYGYCAQYGGGFFDSCFQWELNPQMNIREFADKMVRCRNEEERRQVYEIFSEHGYTSSYEKIGKKEKYIWFIHEIEPLFRKTHAESNEELKKQILELAEAKNPGLFDIGYRATASRFLKKHFSMSTRTYQMLGTMGADDEIEGVSIETYVKYGQNIVKNTRGALHKFMELVISEQNPGVLSLKKTKSGTACEYDKFWEKDKRVIQIQEGILDYASRFAELFTNYYDCLNTDRNVLFTMITSMLSSPARKDAECIKNLNVTITHYADVQNDFSRWYDDCFREKK